MRAKHPIQLFLADALWWAGIVAANLGFSYVAFQWTRLAPLAVPLAIALFVTTAYCELLLMMDTDDWWDDFRAQNRQLVLVPLAQIGAVGCGWWLGWWLAR